MPHDPNRTGESAWRPPEHRLPTLPHTFLARDGDDEANRAAHAALAPLVRLAKDHKAVFVRHGREAMPPLVVATGEAGEPLLDAIVMRVRGAGPTSVRDAALAVADRVARGVAPAKIALITDGYHRGDRTRQPLRAGELQALHESGRGEAAGVGGCLAISAVNRTDDASLTVVPYEWDRSKRDGFRWFPEDDATATFGGKGRIGGAVLDALRSIMDAPLYANTPDIVQGLVEGGFGDADESQRQYSLARSVLVHLHHVDGCILRIFGDRFGDDIEAFIHRTAPPRAEPAMTPERVRDILRQFGAEVRDQNLTARFAAKPQKSVPNRPPAGERDAARRAAQKKKRKGDS